MNPKDRSGSAKPNLSILPLRPLYEVALALYEGARKYGPWNWRSEKVDEVIYVDAAIRHLNQWLAGEDIDPDSGLPHVSKAIAGLVILRDAQHHNCSIDTRRAPQNIDLPDLAARMKVINEKYPNPVGVPTVTITADATNLNEAIDALTEADAEKAAEYYGITDVAQDRCTEAGNGSYQLSPDDMGKTILLRDGRTGRIHNVKTTQTIWPVEYTYEDADGIEETDSCRLDGFSHCGEVRHNSENDIVKVVHN